MASNTLTNLETEDSNGPVSPTDDKPQKEEEEVVKPVQVEVPVKKPEVPVKKPDKKEVESDSEPIMDDDELHSLLGI